MVETLRRRNAASLVPSRDTAVAALFTGWGAIHLLAVLLQLKEWSPFFDVWYAVLGGLFVVSGWLLYSNHRFRAQIGLATLAVAFLSNLYQWAVYADGFGVLVVVTFVGYLLVKVALASLLVGGEPTQSRSQSRSQSQSPSRL